MAGVEVEMCTEINAFMRSFSPVVSVNDGQVNCVFDSSSQILQFTNYANECVGFICHFKYCTRNARPSSQMNCRNNPFQCPGEKIAIIWCCVNGTSLLHAF